MEKKPKKPRSKPRFCYDVNTEFTYLNRECNKFGIFISSIQLLKNNTATDQEIIEYCIKYDYHIITHNKHNFKDYKQDTRIGIIYIGNQHRKFWLNKFKRMMKSYPKHEDLYHKTISIISNKIEIVDRSESLLK